MKPFAYFKPLVLISILSFCAGSAIAATQDKIIHFATEATYPPFVNMQADGTIDGFETALVKALCTEAKLQCDFQHLAFDSLLPSLAYKKIDAIYGGIGSSEERKKQVAFTDIIFENPWGIISNKEQSLDINQDSIKGKKIGVQQGTVPEQYLQKNYKDIIQIKTYASIQDALMELKTKRLDGVVGDAPILKYWLKNTSASNYTILEFKDPDLQKEAQGSVLGFRKEDKVLVDAFNKALQTIKKNGTYEKLVQQYLE